MIHTTSAAEPHFFTATQLMSGNNGYITWIEPSAGNDNVIFTKGNGTTFTKPEHLSDKNGS